MRGAQEAITAFMEDVISDMAGYVPLKAIAERILASYASDPFGDFKVRPRIPRSLPWRRCLLYHQPPMPLTHCVFIPTCPLLSGSAHKCHEDIVRNLALSCALCKEARTEAFTIRAGHIGGLAGRVQLRAVDPAHCLEADFSGRLPDAACAVPRAHAPCRHVIRRPRIQQHHGR